MNITAQVDRALLRDQKALKVELLKTFFSMEPPKDMGEDLLALWDKVFDNDLRGYNDSGAADSSPSISLQTSTGPSHGVIGYSGWSTNDSSGKNPVFPYEILRSIVHDGGNWKWPRIWEILDQLPRRGKVYRENDPCNMGIRNKNPYIKSQSILIVGAGPMGLRLALELVTGGHRVTIIEKRREIKVENNSNRPGNLNGVNGNSNQNQNSSEPQYECLGFTNRINRPHITGFLRNDLERLNGRNFMSTKMCYPVFTNTETASIGIDELQILLLKNCLLMGVEIRLGVTYDDAVCKLNKKDSNKPQWNITMKYDWLAAKKYFNNTTLKKGESFTSNESFDCLIGCDGARSRVRESQPEIFGNIEKRKFKLLYGVVGNLQKVSKDRLKAMGFANGLEPADMKLAQDDIRIKEAQPNFYKASYHNYVVFNPSRKMMEDAGLPTNGVYSFTKQNNDYKGESGTKALALQKEKEQNKEKIKDWIIQRCKAMKIPIDESLPNRGFVAAPNDVMSFDFSEQWVCKNIFNVNLPDYESEGAKWVENAESGRNMESPLPDECVPPIGLVGDAVADPFWLLPVGTLKGWCCLMDTAYLIDNIYNRRMGGLNGRGKIVGTGREKVVLNDMILGGNYFIQDGEKLNDWKTQMNKIKELIPVLQQYSYTGVQPNISTETYRGIHGDQSIVAKQLRQQIQDKKLISDPTLPSFQLADTDPWTRYVPLNKMIDSRYVGDQGKEFIHPIVERELAIKETNIAKEAEKKKNPSATYVPSMVVYRFVKSSGAGGLNGNSSKEAQSESPVSVKKQVNVPPQGGAAAGLANIMRGTVAELNSSNPLAGLKKRQQQQPISPSSISNKSVNNESNSKDVELESTKSGASNTNSPQSKRMFNQNQNTTSTANEISANTGMAILPAPIIYPNMLSGPSTKEAELNHIKTMKKMIKTQMKALQDSYTAYDKAEKELSKSG